MLLLSSGSLYNYGLNRFFEMAKKAGFSGIEIMISDIWDTRDPEYLKKLEKEFGLKIKAVHVPLGDMKSWSGPKLKFTNSLQLAKKIKAEILITHPESSRDEKFFPWLSKNLPQIQSKTKVKIVAENMTKVYNKKTKKLVYQLFDPSKLSFPNLCLDTTHIATAGLDLLKTYQKIKNKIFHVHLSDSFFRPISEQDEAREGIEEDHALPGEGKLPLKEFLIELKKDKYKGIISLELCPETLQAEDVKRVLDNLKKAKEFVIKYFSESFT
jgi:sugar phosphate isomerase/epimerase